MDNAIKVTIPPGMELDTEKSTETTIVFKKTEKTDKEYYNFIQFLYYEYGKGIVCKYLDNCANYNGIPNDFVNILAYHNKFGFSWNCSPEGREYWDKIYFEWVKCKK